MPTEDKPEQMPPDGMPKMRTVDLDGVEVFSAGTYNGDTYTESDLDEMIKAHSEIGARVKPFMKLGHSDEQNLLQRDGHPSAGWVTNLRRKGTKLLADIKKVPEKIGAMIEAGAYGRFSPEIYWNLKDQGKGYKRVLKAVALLGADTPANWDIQDFVNLYEFQHDSLKQYHEVQPMPETTVIDNAAELAAANAKIKALEDSLAVKETEYSKAQEKLQEAERAKTESEIDSKLAAYASKILPKSKALVKALCLSDVSESKVYSYAEKDETKQIKWTSARELVYKFLESMPDAISAPVSTYSNHQETKASLEMSDEEKTYSELAPKVKEYKKANPGVSTADAIRAVTSEE